MDCIVHMSVTLWVHVNLASDTHCACARSRVQINNWTKWKYVLFSFFNDNNFSYNSWILNGVVIFTSQCQSVARVCSYYSKIDKITGKDFALFISFAKTGELLNCVWKSIGVKGESKCLRRYKVCWVSKKIQN